MRQKWKALNIFLNFQKHFLGQDTLWNVSFRVKYTVSLRIQFKCGKISTIKTPNKNTFQVVSLKIDAVIKTLCLIQMTLSYKGKDAY